MPHLFCARGRGLNTTEGQPPEGVPIGPSLENSDAHHLSPAHEGEHQPVAVETLDKVIEVGDSGVQVCDSQAAVDTHPEEIHVVPQERGGGDLSGIAGAGIRMTVRMTERPDVDNVETMETPAPFLFVGGSTGNPGTNYDLDIDGDIEQGNRPRPPRPTESSQAQVVNTSTQEHRTIENSSPSRTGALVWFRYVYRRACQACIGPIRFRYPLHFRILIILLGVAVMLWVVSYYMSAVPAMEHKSQPRCRYNDDQLRQNARMLGVYLILSVIMRLVVSVPGVAVMLYMISAENNGFLRMYVIHMTVHGPLYTFCICSVLFWAQLLQSPTCENSNPILYNTLKHYAAYCCILSAMLLLLVYWYNNMLMEAMRTREEDLRRAPPDTIRKLPTQAYDESVFGDEEGKQYPAECPICLASWEADDTIKVTPCGHAFHEECLGGWLKSERTCALCRHDVTEPAPHQSRSPRRQTSQRSVVPPEIVGATQMQAEQA